MHELSLCRAVASTVTDAADGRRVVAVRLRVGHFRQVVPDTMVWCWTMHTQHTPLDGSTLHVESVPAAVACRACAGHTTLQVPVLRCEHCDSTDVTLVSGEEFEVESIDVASDDADASTVGGGQEGS